MLCGQCALRQMASGQADLHLTGQCRGGGLGPQAQQGFPAVVGVTALVAAASTALCMHIGVPAWGMFAGWIAFVTGGGGGRVTRYCG